MIHLTEQTVTLIGTVFTFLGIVVTAVFSFLSNRNAKEANDAVNHKKADQPRLYELALTNDIKMDELTKWRDTFRGNEYSDGDKIEGVISMNKEKIELLDDKVNVIDGRTRLMDDKLSTLLNR